MRSVPLNLPARCRDQGLYRHSATRYWGHVAMESIRPENTDPIPLRTASPGMGTITIRFVGLLIVTIAVLALIWSR
jgi:hypothetical protein